MNLMLFIQILQNVQKIILPHVNFVKITKFVMDVLVTVNLPGINIINKEETKMYNSVDALKVRIHNLQMKDPVGNARIINKLKRKVRAMESM